MLQTLQRNQVDKMYFEIVFDLSLHHVGEFEACQTGSNIFTFFLSPLWHLGSKINILREPKLLVKPTWTNLLTNQIRPREKTVIQLLSLQKHNKKTITSITFPLSNLHLNYN